MRQVAEGSWFDLNWTRPETPRLDAISSAPSSMIQSESPPSCDDARWTAGFKTLGKGALPKDPHGWWWLKNWGVWRLKMTFCGWFHGIIGWCLATQSRFSGCVYLTSYYMYYIMYMYIYIVRYIMLYISIFF